MVRTLVDHKNVWHASLHATQFFIISTISHFLLLLFQGVYFLIAQYCFDDDVSIITFYFRHFTAVFN